MNEADWNLLNDCHQLLSRPGTAMERQALADRVRKRLDAVQAEVWGPHDDDRQGGPT